MTLHKQKIRRLIHSLAMSWIIWVLAALLFGLVRVWGVEDLPAIQRLSPFVPWAFLLEMLIFGTTIGVPFGILDFFLSQEKIHRLPYWKLIAIKSGAQIVLSVFSVVVLVIVNNHYRHTDLGILHFIFSPSTYLWLVFSGIISLFIYFLQVVRSKFGEKMMINILLGKYHYPRVESRIFMFLDMRSSTTHAESLGHIRFSSLLQHCFRDLTSAIILHDVEIYQYVGDEAILTWKVADGLRNENCLRTYFHFIQFLEKKRGYYEKKYGFLPFFKAGVHLGDVTVSEVGVVKREIAYHSDVLNTAARIQGKCNEFDAGLLVSEKLKDMLSVLHDISFEQIGGISLRGKHLPVNIYKAVLLQSR
ncbi:MAG: adenylate/guanylate cyclase domain-containing protein [Cyclobacteriaceae bacterium]|nr:adenylate/guanylate cyclase domain-containing protein [Cyclobacteriaceae bacterium]